MTKEIYLFTCEGSSHDPDDSACEAYECEREALVRALDWAGYPVEDLPIDINTETLRNILSETIDVTGEAISVFPVFYYENQGASE